MNEPLVWILWVLLGYALLFGVYRLGMVVGYRKGVDDAVSRVAQALDEFDYAKGDQS